jgi:hypothetical protein
VCAGLGLTATRYSALTATSAGRAHAAVDDEHRSFEENATAGAAASAAAGAAFAIAAGRGRCACAAAAVTCEQGDTRGDRDRLSGSELERAARIATGPTRSRPLPPRLPNPPPPPPPALMLVEPVKNAQLGSPVAAAELASMLVPMIIVSSATISSGVDPVTSTMLFAVSSVVTWTAQILL